MEQRQIFVNNLAIRRATEELKVARDYRQVCRILAAAFSSNDFDGFELRPAIFAKTAELQLIHGQESDTCFRWKKATGLLATGSKGTWNLTLDLLTRNNSRLGSMTVYRGYSGRDLQLDINLLTSAFPLALAEALERVFAHEIQFASAIEGASALTIAQAG